MKVLVLSKRYPQGRDLFNRPYGRFFYLPFHLSQLGYQVTMLLFGYNNDPPEFRHQYGMDWYSESLNPRKFGYGCVQYIARAKALIQAEKPDWIVGFSDTWYGILAEYLGAHYGIKTLIDAYDNYESYLPYAAPLHWLWRNACRRADLLTAAGPALLDFIGHNSSAARLVLPMSADPIFQKMNRDQCRIELGLPIDVPIVGYFGSLDRTRDVDMMVYAATQLIKLLPDVRFLFSGRSKVMSILPRSIQKNIISLGYVTDENMPMLVNASNVIWSVSLPSTFGHFSHPVKLVEAMQCGVPVVATHVEATAWMLRDAPQCLVPPKDAHRLAEQTFLMLDGRITPQYQPQTTWNESAMMLNTILKNSS